MILLQLILLKLEDSSVQDVVNEIQIGNRSSLKEYAQDVWITTQVRGLAAKNFPL